MFFAKLLYEVSKLSHGKNFHTIIDFYIFKFLLSTITIGKNMIRRFTQKDLPRILEIEKDSFPKEPYDDFVFNYDDAYYLITRHFKVSNLKGFDLEEKTLAIQAAGGLLAFLKETQRDILPNIFKINIIQEKQILHLDYITQRNLELITSLWEKGRETTLYSIFNHSHTPMGARLLKKIILQPLTNIDEINHRLNIVQKFKDDIFLRSELREELKIIGDLERYINKINYSRSSNARDLVNIKNSLEKIPKIKKILEKSKIPEISKFLEKSYDFREIRSLIEVSIKDEPPTTIKEGNIVKYGFNEEIDNLRDILNNGKKYILEYENEQKLRWRLNSGFKIGYNNILGYYIQITLNTLKSIPRLPEEYVERQTLKNAKRFTTVKLKQLEEKIIKAEEEINDLVRPSNMEKAIYIIHTPPSNISLDVCHDGKKVGSKAVYEFLKKYQPLLSFHGHIHESAEVSGKWYNNIGRTLCIQPGQSHYHEKYLVYTLIDLETMELERKVII